MDKRTIVPNARFFQNLVANVVKHNDRREQEKAATMDLLKAKGNYNSVDLNIKNLNSGNIWIMDFYLSAIQMPSNCWNYNDIGLSPINKKNLRILTKFSEL